MEVKQRVCLYVRLRKLASTEDLCHLLTARRDVSNRSLEDDHLIQNVGVQEELTVAALLASSHDFQVAWLGSHETLAALGDFLDRRERAVAELKPVFGYVVEPDLSLEELCSIVRVSV